MKHKVLDHGFVEVEEVMGDESTIVNCARISKGEKIKTASTLDMEDTTLIRTLIENGHGTPFEHCVYRFRIKAPIFIMRQWMRHRIGTFNEYSMRYREPINEYYTPSNLPNKAKYQKLMNKLFKFYNESYTDRQINIDPNDIPRRRYREMFRCALPVSAYTEVIWTVNLRSLINFIKQRFAPDAQYEIYLYAQVINDIVRERFPHVIN